jgi:hypothetical protein
MSWIRSSAVLAALVSLDAGGGEKQAQRLPVLTPVGGGPPSGPALRRYPLRRDGARGWVLDDARFGARIAEDGTVTFTQGHGTVLFPLLPLPLPMPEGTPTLEGSLRKLDPAHRRPPPRIEIQGPLPTITPYRPDPSEVCVYPNPCHFQASIFLVNVAGTFDVTDEILRLGHNDPYRNLKAQFMASTADFRAELRQRAQHKAQQQALAALRARLDAIAGERRPAAERQAAMRALEDELDPDPAVAGPARTLIEARLRTLGATR